MGYGLPRVIKLGIMSGGIPGEDLSSSEISATTGSVVGTMAAIDAGAGGDPAFRSVPVPASRGRGFVVSAAARRLMSSTQRRPSFGHVISLA
jgi:hypothetical protein